MTFLDLRTDVNGRSVVVSLAGELDLAGAALLERELERVRAEHDPEVLVLDLSGLQFMDSTGLRLVILADARAREEGRRLALVRGREPVQRVFDLTRMTERLDFVDSRDDALREDAGG